MGEAGEELPHWSAAAACQQVLLCQPSSAAVERVFSSLKNSFGDQQSRALEDYIELALMLQHNKRRMHVLCYCVCVPSVSGFSALLFFN